jgi:hypothetical protein
MAILSRIISGSEAKAARASLKAILRLTSRQQVRYRKIDKLLTSFDNFMS